MILKTKLFGHVYEFKDVCEVMAKANEEKSGDKLAGIAAETAEERVAAKVVLSHLTLNDLRNKLDGGLARELQQREGLIVTHSVKGKGNVRGVRIEQYKVPDSFQSDLLNTPPVHARAYTKK